MTEWLLLLQDKWVLDHEDVLLGERIGQVSDSLAMVVAVEGMLWLGTTFRSPTVGLLTKAVRCGAADCLSPSAFFLLNGNNPGKRGRAAACLLEAWPGASLPAALFAEGKQSKPFHP